MPEQKLAGYALDPAHPRGRHKARVFSSALGIEQKDWRYLRDQLAEGIVEAPVDGMRITPFGVLYEAVVLVDGLNGGNRARRDDLDYPGRAAASARLDLGGHPVTGCHTLRCMGDRRHAVLDVVEFLTASGRWAAGTRGTVVEADDQRALVEIADDRGRATDFVSLPHDKLASVGQRTTRAAS